MISHCSVLGCLPTKLIPSWPPEIGKLFSQSFFALKIPELVVFVWTCNAEGLVELLLSSNTVSQSREQFPTLSLDLLRETTETDLLLHLLSPVEE